MSRKSLGFALSEHQIPYIIPNWGSTRITYQSHIHTELSDIVSVPNHFPKVRKKHIPAVLPRQHVICAIKPVGIFPTMPPWYRRDLNLAIAVDSQNGHPNGEEKQHQMRWKMLLDTNLCQP